MHAAGVEKCGLVRDILYNQDAGASKYEVVWSLLDGAEWNCTVLARKMRSYSFIKHTLREGYRI